MDNMMGNIALAYAVRVIWQVWSWFGVVLNATGTRHIYLTFFAFAIVFRLLIAPLVGQSLRAGSDTVKAPRNSAHRSRNTGHNG